MPETPHKFYLTTPIYYVNARPHIGHAYSTIVADVLARRHRLLGAPNGDQNTYFLTGTDEHGQKIERSAAAAGIPPQQFADQVSAQFRSLWDRMGLTYNQFIRTTDEKHIRGVQHLFRELYNRGHIYLDSYTGAYCVSDEAFVDAPVGTPCPDCGKLLEEVTEENFFFRLSAFQKPLLDLIESNTLTITPDSARNEVLSFIRGGLKDLSISRSSFTWGIPVPDDILADAKATKKHVVYVWLDALANYMTALGYGSDDTALFDKFWPADIHLVGKEITRFHCVYWPAFLLAAGLPLPKQVTANGWLLFDNSKMSKSKGNVVRTETILDALGTLCPPSVALKGTGFSPSVETPKADAALAAEGNLAEPSKADHDLFAADILRYYLLREIPFGQDGSFSFDSLITRYNADLANGYGNLVSRTLNMISSFASGAIPDSGDRRFPAHTDVVEVYGTASVAIVSAWEKNSSSSPDTLAKAAMLLVASADQFITKRTPWKLAKEGEAQALQLADTLYVAAESIRIITALLYPILPYATARVWQQLGLGDIEQAAENGELRTLTWGGLKPGTKLGPLGPIFPRAPKELAQTMSEIEEQNSQLANSKLTTQQDQVSGSSLEGSKLSAQQDPSQDPTHPAAGPRTSTLPEPNGTLPVAGSTALTTGPAPDQPAPQPAPENEPPTTPQITIDDFAKIELRVAQITLAERIPKADKLLRLEVDLGPFGQRQILSGIAEFYTPEELTGRRIVVITNLAPRKMRGLESHGMLLAASDGDHGKPHLATCGDEIALGSRLK